MTDIPLNHEVFAVVPVFNNKPSSDAILWGSLPEIMGYIGQTQARAEAEQRMASAREQLQSDAKILAHAQQITVDTATKLTAMGHAMVTAREKQARRDADARKAKAEAAEQKRIQAKLDLLPDPDDRDAAQAATESALGDDGDLHSIKPPIDTEKYDPEGVEDAVTGVMPPELDKGAPPEAGEYSATLPPASSYRDPTAIGGP